MLETEHVNGTWHPNKGMANIYFVVGQDWTFSDLQGRTYIYGL
jgi:hypothetical protein